MQTTTKALMQTIRVCRNRVVTAGIFLVWVIIWLHGNASDIACCIQGRTCLATENRVCYRRELAITNFTQTEELCVLVTRTFGWDFCGFLFVCLFVWVFFLSFFFFLLQGVCYKLEVQYPLSLPAVYLSPTLSVCLENLAHDSVTKVKENIFFVVCKFS